MNDLIAYQQQAAHNHARAAYQSRYYTLGQLTQFYKTASVGFVCAAFASWVLLAFFIGQFMAGGEFEDVAQWRSVQYLYAGMGIALATAIVVAEAVLFNAGRSREYWVVVVFAVGFSIFAEAAATMQREQTAVAYKSTQSEVYKATIRAVDVLAANTTLSPAQIQLSHLQAKYEEAKGQGKTAAMESIQARITRLEYQAELEQANRANTLQGTLQQAKALEYDETKHQAMIRFLAEVFGFSHVMSSALLAFFLVLTFKLCFHYLGNQRQLNGRALSISRGDIGMTITPIQMAASPTLPYANSPALPPADTTPPGAKNTKLGSEEEEPASTPHVHVEPPHAHVGNDASSVKSSVYTIAETAKVGQGIACPNCGAVFQKSNKWHTFCKPACRDSWHNTQNPDRAAHAKRRKTG